MLGLHLFLATVTLTFGRGFSDDSSVVLRIARPRGTVRSREVFVEVDIEAFAGTAASTLRADVASWRICYAASQVPVADSKAMSASVEPAALAEGALSKCVGLGAQSLPSLFLSTENHGVVGVAEHWRLDTWLQHSGTGQRIAETYARWRLEIPAVLRETAVAVVAEPPPPPPLPAAPKKKRPWSWLSGGVKGKNGPTATLSVPAAATAVPFAGAACAAAEPSALSSYRIKGGALFADVQV